MPESKPTNAKSTAKKRAEEAKPSAKKPTTKKLATSKSATTKKSTSTRTPAKISDVTPTAKSTHKTKNASTSAKATTTKAKVAKASTVKTKATTKKPSAQKVVDSFVIPGHRRKTTAGDPDMDWDKLEKSVEDYDSDKKGKISKVSKKADAEKFKAKKPTARKVFHQPAKSARTKRIFKILGIVFSALLGVASLVLAIMIIAINLLPNIYLVPLLAIIVIIAVAFSTIMCHPKVKPGIKTPFLCLSLLFTGIYTVGIVYLNHTFNFFDSLKGQEYITESYYVLVEKDSPYQNLKDLNDKTVGTFDEGIEIYQQAIEKLQKANKTLRLENVDSINALPEKLMANEVDAVLMSAMHKELLAEDDNKFNESTRVVYTIEIKVKANIDTNHPDIDVTTEPFTVFISGSDAYGNLSDRSRSDVNMLATVNPQTHEVLLTSIPRDYYVQLHGTTGARDKLTHAGIYGVQMSVNTLADLLDIKIDYYVKVNFSTLVSLVDTIGGIEVYSDQQFVPWTNRHITIPKGNVHMDGAMALAFARERKSYATGDRHRVQNQQDVLTTILKKVSSSTVILTKYSEILSDLSNCIETNFGKDEISQLIKLQLKDMPSWQIASYSLNGSDSHNVTYSMGNQMLYVMEPNLQTVQTAHDNITAIIEGKPLSELKLTEK